MTEGDTLLEDIEDLSLGSGIGMISRCRPAGGRGFSHGGVAVAFKESTCTFKHLKNHNPEGYEVLAAIGNLPGHTRKMIAIACYMPPGDCAARGKGCLEYIQNLVIKYKRKYKEPYLVVAGDFNQWDINEALSDFIDLSEANVGPTRDQVCIDKVRMKGHMLHFSLGVGKAQIDEFDIFIFDMFEKFIGHNGSPLYE